MSAFAFSINRNIMECKVPYYDEETTAITVLIETLWNVKSQTTYNKWVGATTY